MNPSDSSTQPTVTPPRAVLFDMDGVLVDSFNVWVRVMNDAAVALGAPAITAEQITQTWGRGIEADQEIYYPSSTLAEVEREFERAFPSALPALDVMDGAAALFAALKQRGIRTAVVTNTPHSVARSVLDHAGLSPDALVGSTDVEHSKPAPDMMLKACASLGVETQEAVVVGDSIYDAQSARAAGCAFIGFRRDDEAASIDELPELLQRPEFIAPSDLSRTVDPEVESRG